ncbi:MAG: lysine 5,6-aminomutase subunit alpha TIM-barrel domain-containing protein, partial [Promethearchaeota archaeon]
KQGLFNTIEKGIFANIKRSINGGKGLKGVIKREKNYYNPFMEIMAKQLKGGRD